MSTIFHIFFFFNDTATTEIYTLSLHDALPISSKSRRAPCSTTSAPSSSPRDWRSEEHTSELQSRLHLVCRLLLEKKKKRRAPLAAPSRPAADARLSPRLPPHEALQARPAARDA